MDNYYSIALELDDILSSLACLKDQTLDHFFENKKIATKLMTDLCELENETKILIKDLDF